MSQTEQVTQTPRLVARVKWFNARRGYGYVTNVETGSDLFVHHSGLTVGEENVYRMLVEGEYVECSTTTDDQDRTLAVDVTGLSRGLLMCQTRALRQAQNDRDGRGRDRREGDRREGGRREGGRREGGRREGGRREGGRRERSRSPRRRRSRSPSDCRQD
jgi:cold shock CspA family protein